MNKRYNALYWKSYVWMLGTLLFWNYMAMTPFKNIWYYVDFAFSMLGYSGFVMFVYGRKFLKPWVWKIWAFIMVGWDVYVNFFSPVFADPSISRSVSNTTAIFFIVMLLPEYIGIFLYGYFARHIWDSTDNDHKGS